MKDSSQIIPILGIRGRSSKTGPLWMLRNIYRGVLKMGPLAIEGIHRSYKRIMKAPGFPLESSRGYREKYRYDGSFREEGT